MRKTSLYLAEADAARLRRLAEQGGLSQADVIRTALAAFESQRQADRGFVLEGSWSGDGSSVADTSEEDLPAGFGQ